MTQTVATSPGSCGVASSPLNGERRTSRRSAGRMAERGEPGEESRIDLEGVAVVEPVGAMAGGAREMDGAVQGEEEQQRGG